MNRSKILENRDDLIEGTFIYELHELRRFNKKLYFELIDGINDYLSAEQVAGRKPDQEMLSFLSWFVMGVMNSVIAHNNANDCYVIEDFDMSSWCEDYEGKLESLLNRIVALV